MLVCLAFLCPSESAFHPPIFLRCPVSYHLSTLHISHSFFANILPRQPVTCMLFGIGYQLFPSLFLELQKPVFLHAHITSSFPPSVGILSNSDDPPSSLSSPRHREASFFTSLLFHIKVYLLQVDFLHTASAHSFHLTRVASTGCEWSIG